ncbi:MAG: hypothetical protein J7L10_05480 [Methanomicrobia archaeon]|nr:hypothetical protein [Methanomicrobia archaeon]
MKKRKKFVLKIDTDMLEGSKDIMEDEFSLYYSKLSEEEKQKLYEENLRSVEEDYAEMEFIERIKNNINYIDIINKLIIETDRSKGLTSYEISKDLDMDQGYVRRYLVELKEANLVLMNEKPKRGRMRHEYWMDIYRKRWFFMNIPWIGVDYEDETEDILILLSKRKLMNPKNEIKKKSKYRDIFSLSYNIGKLALSVAQEIENDIYLPTIEVEKRDIEDLIPYGIAFNAIRDAIFKGYLKDVFGEKERIQRLKIFPYPRAYEFYDLDEFIEDAQALYEHSEEVIDRMFFRKPEFFPDTKNGGKES